ncbi:MAG: UbiD family decarboxylase [Saprospiraceae bacterium]|nr:UbiD family decarboxylase [Saprospiraceae bacterium]
MSLETCIKNLHKKGELIVIDDWIDPDLEMAEIHRRIYSKKGPALLFTKVKGSPFKACSNIYGTHSRCEYIFKDAIKGIEHLIKLKQDPLSIIKDFGKHFRNLPFYFSGFPLKSIFNKSIINNQCKISDLPQIISWPEDGGAFITLPQVISFPPNSRKIADSNIGMYRIQISGNEYIKDEEIGLHYQLHRGIGIHHTEYNKSGDTFNISIGIGGHPAYALGSIFPLPEGLSEILFTGLLQNKSYRYFWHNDFFIPSEVDFCITGTVVKNKLKPEGPFGDHLGYYSLMHQFPFLKVNSVYHKKNPIWHFTVVGRPPQEDSGFGYLIHQMVKEISKTEFPGIQEIHAVDVAGVHPLLLAIGSERYMPFRERKPEEILTQANHLLGKGQTSLAKYLFITTNEDNYNLTTHSVEDFFSYVLQRLDWRYDLHFQTHTTIDTLDYSGSSWNSGSKLVLACNRTKIRNLSSDKSIFTTLPSNYSINCSIPGIFILQMSNFSNYPKAQNEIEILCSFLETLDLEDVPLIVIVDDLEFTKQSFDNFLWVCFTRSNPSYDIYGVKSFIDHKHWGCNGSLIIDARIKPHHAPELIPDKMVTSRVDQLFNKNIQLRKYLE